MVDMLSRNAVKSKQTLVESTYPEGTIRGSLVEASYGRYLPHGHTTVLRHERVRGSFPVWSHAV
jgi:hypothetical protein